MSSSSAAAAGASSLDIEELIDDLAIHRTILASIEENPHDSHTPIRIAGLKRDIARIQKDLSKARRNNQAPATTNSTSNGTMNSWHQPDTHAGPSYYSNSGSHTPASMSTSATSSSGPAQRKRAFGAHMDDDDSFGPRGKSRRTTPSPFATPLAGDDLFGDDDSIVDLTGDDADIDQALEQQKLAFAHIERTKQDERLARSMQRNLQNDGYSNTMPASPAPTGPNAFDRILSRQSQSSSQSQPSHFQLSQGLPSYGQEQSLSQSSNLFPHGASQPNRFPMPGSYDFDDEDGLNGYDPSPSLPTRPYSASATGSSNTSMPTMGPSAGRSSAMNLYPMITPGMDFVPNIPAADLARQAALARQQGYGPSGGYGAGVDLPGSNGFASYAGDTSPMASLSNRPGMLTSSSYAPLQNWDFNNALNVSSALPAPPRGYLGNIIDHANQIDWDNGLDADGNPISDRLRTFAEDLYDDPRKTAEEIKDLLANIRPDEDIPEEDRVGTPEALRYPLYPHQQLALQWMMNTEKGKNKSGVLADDSK